MSPPRRDLSCRFWNAGCLAIGVFVGLLSGLNASLAQPPATPQYGELFLDSIFPAGGQRGQSVTVEITGPANNSQSTPLAGLSGVRGLVIDGPAGITVREVKNLSPQRVQAVLDIAADAAPGRRMIRVHSDRSGLSSGIWFVVGSLPETAEVEPNPSRERSQLVESPTVVNGRIQEPLDIDCFRFHARQGESIVAAINAHGIDRISRGRKTYGYLDFSLEVLGPDGAVVAEAQDTLGLDPVVNFTAPVTGEYTAKVFLVGYLGCPEAVYQLTLGAVAYPTAVFPPGGKRGTGHSLLVTGPNVPAGTTIPFTATSDTQPMTWLVPPQMHHEVPFVLGDRDETREQEPNGEAAQANELKLGTTVNGLFDQPGDVDQFQITLGKKQRVRLDLVAQRFLREGVDTLLEVYDQKGTLLASNDDVSLTDVEVQHDFEPFDSGLTFDSTKPGKYLVRVSEQTGAAGPRAAYRLTAFEPQPEFALQHWPDAVPIWGPGSTAAFIVTVDRQAVVGQKDITLTIEGLPPGWKGSTSVSLGVLPGVARNHGRRVLMTITAPREVPVGTIATFRVVGRVEVSGKLVERVAQPVTTYITTDRAQVRWSAASRAAVALPQGPYLETDVERLTVVEGKDVELPVRLVGDNVDGKWALIACHSTNGVAFGLGVQQEVTVRDGQTIFPLATQRLPVGTHSIVVARAYRSDIRINLPGPCTPIVLVDVVSKSATTAGK